MTKVKPTTVRLKDGTHAMVATRKIMIPTVILIFVSFMLHVAYVAIDGIFTTYDVSVNMRFYIYTYASTNKLPFAISP